MEAAAVSADRGGWNCCWRNRGQRVNQGSLQYISDENEECANRSLVVLQGFKRLHESKGQSIYSPYKYKTGLKEYVDFCILLAIFYPLKNKQFMKRSPGIVPFLVRGVT